MPDPLPSDVVAKLRTDPTAALAAALILASSCPDVVSWALRTFTAESSEPKASVPDGFVTLPSREREASAPRESSGCCDCGPPGGQRVSAKRTVRLGRDEVALDVEGVVNGGVRGKKFLG